MELLDIPATLRDVCGLPIPDTLPGRSLLPILEGRADAGSHRDVVRSVYYEVLAGPRSYATMIRNRRYKLVNYHGHGLGELFDLENDPHEFANLWDDPAHRQVRFDLMQQNFDAMAFAVDTGSKRTGRY